MRTLIASLALSIALPAAVAAQWTAAVKKRSEWLVLPVIRITH
jgi:hypothetical protein